MKSTTDAGVQVCVVIPCYNDGRYLNDAVQSILAQTFRSFRIIIVDDCSSDARTKEVLDDLAQHDLIQVVRLEQNGGPARARNAGIALADTPYILTLDASDRFAPTFLEKAVPVLENNAAVGVVTCGVQEFGLQTLYWIPRGGTVENFLVENSCCGNALFRRRFWEDAGGYDADILYEDWDFWISGTSKGWEVHVLKEPLFFYRKEKATKSAGDAPMKAETYRRMVAKHKDVFCAHIEDVLHQKEAQLLSQYFSPDYQKYLRLVTLVSNVRFFLMKLLGRRPHGFGKS